jgi:hypothetical protein
MSDIDTRPLHFEDDEPEFVRLPGMYRRSEIQLVLRPGCDFHVQPERVSPGTQLFNVYQQEFAPPPAREVRSDGGGDGDGPAVAPRSSSSDTSQLDAPSLGELRSRHRDEHLCLKCEHHLVCGMARALDPNLLVTITKCLGFKPAAFDETGICELMPIEPLPHP